MELELAIVVDDRVAGVAAAGVPGDVKAAKATVGMADADDLDELDKLAGDPVDVYVNDRQIGVWRFPPRRYFFGEDQFLIPGSFIQGDTVVLRFEHIPDPRGLTSLNSFYYWFYVVEGGL